MQLLPHVWDHSTEKCLRCGMERQDVPKGTCGILYLGYCPPMDPMADLIGRSLGEEYAAKQVSPRADEMPTPEDLDLADRIGRFLGKTAVH